MLEKIYRCLDPYTLTRCRLVSRRQCGVVDDYAGRAGLGLAKVQWNALYIEEQGVKFRLHLQKDAWDSLPDVDEYVRRQNTGSFRSAYAERRRRRSTGEFLNKV